MADIIVIGGGTAGLTAALYARRAGKSVTLFEKESTGGQIVYSPSIENYPGLPGISGADYAAALTEQAEHFGVHIEYAEVTSVRRTGTGVTVESDAGTLSADALIIASGTAHRKLGVDLEDDLVGCGVSYCAVCDGAFYKDQIVAVNGGGNSALQDALLLSETCSRVYLIHRRDRFRGEEKLVEALRGRENVEFVLNASVTELLGEDELNGIVVEQNGERRWIELNGLFVAIGHEPDNTSFRNVVKLDASGYVSAGEDCMTGTAGVFVAGDCRSKKVRQVATAAADGAVAALAACAWLES